jgi:VTC domain
MRYEYKYFVPYTKLEPLRRAILPFVNLDSFAQKFGGQYSVKSIYFDTPRFLHYQTKVDGAANRLKVRMRGYNEGGADATVFFEIKRKYEMPIRKNRAQLRFSEALDLLGGNADVDDFIQKEKWADDARRFLYQIKARQMRPVVNVIYEREPYLTRATDPANDARITFDKNLRSVAWPNIEQLFDETDAKPVYNGCFVLEIKFNLYCPVWLRDIVDDLKLYREAASKYTACIDCQPSINPEKAFQTMSKGQLF